MNPTIAALATVFGTGSFSAWWSAVEAAGVSTSDREILRRAIEHDQRLWSAFPDSIASCLIARTQGLPGLERLRAAWLAEVSASGRPWVRTYQALPLAPGLLRTLSTGEGLTLNGLQRVSFAGEDTVTLEAAHVHPSFQAPERRAERLCWAWRVNEARLEPDSGVVPPAPYPRFEKDGWGPVRMRIDAVTEPVELPCPPDATADAQLGRDGRTIIVSGSLDEYSGGFVWFVRERGPRRFEVERALETPRPVLSVHESSDGNVVLARTSAGLMCWARGGCRTLAIRSDNVALSPSGEHVAVRKGHSVQVWSVEATSGDVHGPTLPARFSPDGARLVRGSTLYDGMSGQPVAELDAMFGQYLEGGPAEPWFHLGDDFVINSHSGLQVWRAVDGTSVTVSPMRLPHWMKLAHDDAGQYLAVLHRGEVQVHDLPSGQVVATLSFDLEGPEALAMSPGGRRIAVAEGADIEVRSPTGEVIRRFRHPVPDGEDSPRPRFHDASLRFTDEDHVVSYVMADGWRLFRLVEGTSDPCGKPRVGSQRRPADWKVEATGYTVFTHEPTGTRVALPVSGEWVVHPTRPTILACDGAHVELMGFAARE